MAITHWGLSGVSSGFIFPPLLPGKVTDGCIKQKLYRCYLNSGEPDFLQFGQLWNKGPQGKGGFLLMKITKGIQTRIFVFMKSNKLFSFYLFLFFEFIYSTKTFLRPAPLSLRSFIRQVSMSECINFCFILVYFLSVPFFF